MKFSFLFLSFFTVSLTLLAQKNDGTPPEAKNGETIHTSVERLPYFPGGGIEFKRFLDKNLQYPETAKKQNIQGTVFIRFVVEKDGSLSEFKILRSPGTELSNEATRILKLSPKWSPGMQNSEPVRTLFTIPILFNLNNGQLDPPTEQSLNTPPADVTDERIYNAVDVNPAFPDGEAGFSKFLSKHIKYPEAAKQNNVRGRVFIQFIVERDGNLSNIVILRDPGSGLGDEAVRVMRLSPKWIPGIKKGKVVRVQFTVPINFSFQ